jgi:cobalt/nickel transport system permease protein
MVGLWAVHISAGVLQWPWLVAGFVIAALLILAGSIHLPEDEDMAITAVFTAVFFVASLIHIRVGPTSVHLLMNGLVGVTLGRRACLAIPVGLFLQAALLGHGDISTLGVNTCILAAPALIAPLVYRIGLLSPALGMSYAVLAVAYTLIPWSVALVGPAVFALRRLDRRLELSDEYRAGFLVGAATVMVTACLNGLVLVKGGNQDWLAIAVGVGLAHIPVAIVEGVVTGFAVSFLSRVKPELLHHHVGGETGESSSSGTSH